MIFQTYTWYGTALYTFLTDTKMISGKTAPLAARAIHYDKTSIDGWDILYHFLKSRNPLLGGDSDDIITDIATLRITHNEDIRTHFL